MNKRTVTPTRTVEFDGRGYRVRGNVAIPILEQMDRFAALLWINRHTYARGYQVTSNPLAGFGAALSIRTS